MAEAEIKTGCPTPGCSAPALPCGRGEDDHRNCKSWSAVATQEAATEKSDAPTTNELLLPWSGSAFGSLNMPFVTGRSNAKLVGVLGPHNAGKTTLLAAWYLLLGRGIAPEGREFAGSYTFAGWESVAHSLRWEGPNGPTFPLHTASGAGRQPGTLHLAFRTETGRLEDHLFADTPGEWFTQWALDRDSEAAAGARWVAKNSTVLILVADSESLSGSDRGTARNDLKLLAKRVGHECQDKPVALVWTKSDKRVSREMRATVQEAVNAANPKIVEFSVSVIPSKAALTTDPLLRFADLLTWVTSSVSADVPLPSFPSTRSDPVFNYGIQ